MIEQHTLSVKKRKHTNHIIVILLRMAIIIDLVCNVIGPCRASKPVLGVSDKVIFKPVDSVTETS